MMQEEEAPATQQTPLVLDGEDEGEDDDVYKASNSPELEDGTTRDMGWYTFTC